LTFPFQLHIGSFIIPVHTLLETLGIFVGFRYFLYLRRKKGDVIESSNRVWIIIAAIFGALLGARLLGALEDPTAWQAADNPLLYFYQNKTVVGGFLGGLIGVEAVKKMLRETASSGDLFVFPMIVALGIGRGGCFSMGVYEQTYGLPTSLVLGMNLGDGISRHPVTIYEIVYLFLLWIFLKQLQKRSHLVNGSLYKIFMIGYLLFRFLLDFIKPHYTLPFGLSTIQVACVAGLIYYLPYIIQPKKLTSSYA
jgi:prolipoprotein diacylglyceryltransferase